MKTIVVKDRRPIPLGRVGENEATTIRFNLASFFPGLSGALYGLVHQLPGAVAPYVVQTIRDPDDGRPRDGFIDWVVKAVDLGEISGSGTAQLTAYIDVGSSRRVYKTVTFTTIIENSMGVYPPPPATTPWVDQVTQAGVAAQDAAENAASSANAAKASADAAAETEANVGTTVDTALAAAKASGDFDGYSPTVAITPITGGNRVTITDVDGNHTFDVMNGVDAGGDYGEVFWAEYGTTTAAEIETAFQAGKVIYLMYAYYVHRLEYRPTEGIYVFFCTYVGAGRGQLSEVRLLDTTWTHQIYSLVKASDIPTAASEIGGIMAPDNADANDVLTFDGDVWTAMPPAVQHDLPTGGSKGAVLVKNSSTNYDAVWGSIVYTFHVYVTDEFEGTAFSPISVAELLEKINSPVVYAGVENGRIPLYRYYQSTYQGATVWNFIFVGSGMYNGNPCTVLVEFYNQPAAATQLNGTVSRFTVGAQL